MNIDKKLLSETINRIIKEAPVSEYENVSTFVESCLLHAYKLGYSHGVADKYVEEKIKTELKS